MRGTILSGTLAAKPSPLKRQKLQAELCNGWEGWWFRLSNAIDFFFTFTWRSVDPLRLQPHTPPKLEGRSTPVGLKTIFCSLNLSRPLPGLLLGGGLVHLPVRPEIIVRFSLVPPLRTYADITSILICLPAFIEYLSSSLPTTPPDRNLAAYALKHSHSHRHAIIISAFIADYGLRHLSQALLLLSTPLFTETLGSPS